MHKQKKIDAGYSRALEEHSIQKTNDSRVVRVDGADEDWGSGKHIAAAMENSVLRENQIVSPVKSIPSECHGMGLYEKPPKKYTMGRAAKFYELADDSEGCHKTKVDHVAARLEKGI